MILATLTLLTGPLAPGAFAATDPGVHAAPELVAIKARRVLVGDGTEIEHAVLLVDGGKIVTIGQDLPIERGIPVIELGEDQIVMPGLVDAYSRFGLDGGGYNDSRAQVKASAELFPGMSFRDALEAGVTTLALYPAGTGVPGQAVVIRTSGSSPEDLVLADGAYLKIVMRPSSTNKRNLKKGFEDVAKHREKVEKEREKFEKKTKPSSDKKDEEKDEEKKDDEKKTSSKKKEEFVPPAPDDATKPWLDVADKKLRALVTIDSAAGYDHFLDALGKEEMDWHLRIGLTRESDFFHVKDKIGEKGCFAVMDPEITLHPGTMRQRNLPAEFARAGAKLVLIPRSDSSGGFESVARGRRCARRCRPRTPPAVKSLTQHGGRAPRPRQAELGTLAEGKRANLIILSGDPFEPGTEVDAVMLDGKFVHGETRL
jgi:hypothetical protein